MKLDLLYKVEEPVSITPDNTIYNLSLDRTMDMACADVRAKNYFLNVVANPLTKMENINYRREILFDFLENKELYYALWDILGKFIDEESISGKERKYRYNISKSNDDAVSFSNSKQALQMTALTMNRVLDLLKNFNAMLDSYEIKSEGLLILKNRVKSLVEAEDFERLKGICGYFRRITEIESIEACLALDKDCRIILSKLLSVNKEKEKESDGGFFKFIKKKNERTDVNEGGISSAKLPKISQPLGNTILYHAFSHPSKVIDSIINSIFFEFRGLRDQLLFYKAGCKFCSFMDEKKIPYVFPELVTEPVFRCKGLLDTHLCALFPVASYVIPNDAFLDGEKKGIMVFGENNSGKTVYLRSIGTAQLLAQAGFPVTAETATIGLRNGVFTQFASGEKEFEEGNEAGRFEQEVREIAKVIDNSDENSLILFNETFQTTSYAEGADGLYHILGYLSRKNTHWVLVSHLSDLRKKFTTGVNNLKTTPGYKLEAE